MKPLRVTKGSECRNNDDDDDDETRFGSSTNNRNSHIVQTKILETPCNAYVSGKYTTYMCNIQYMHIGRRSWEIEDNTLNPGLANVPNSGRQEEEQIYFNFYTTERLRRVLVRYKLTQLIRFKISSARTMKCMRAAATLSELLHTYLRLMQTRSFDKQITLTNRSLLCIVFLTNFQKTFQAR